MVSGHADPPAVVGEHETVEGQMLEVTGSGDDLMINEAAVVCGGIKTAKATRYLLDTVPMPPVPTASTTSATETATTSPTP